MEHLPDSNVQDQAQLPSTESQGKVQVQALTPLPVAEPTAVKAKHFRTS